MILNSQSVDLIRANSARLANCIRTKDDIAELATATNYEQVLYAIESLLTNTEMYFDDELLAILEESNWKSFKALLMVYTLNIVNRNNKTDATARTNNAYEREFGASSHI